MAFLSVFWDFTVFSFRDFRVLFVIHIYVSYEYFDHNQAHASILRDATSLRVASSVMFFCASVFGDIDILHLQTL